MNERKSKKFNPLPPADSGISYQTVIKTFSDYIYHAVYYASSLKVIQKSVFVLSRSRGTKSPGWSAPIRSAKRPVWASSLPDSFNKTMAVVKRENQCLSLFRIVVCTCRQHNMDAENAEVSDIFTSFYSVLKT